MADKWALEDGSGFWTLEESADYWILEENPGDGQPIHKRFGGVPFAHRNPGVWRAIVELFSPMRPAYGSSIR